MQKKFSLLVLIIWIVPIFAAAQSSQIPGWPEEIKRVEIKSSIDGSYQPSLFYLPENIDKSPVPLLVALHTWSGDYTQRESRAYLEWCMENGWAFIHPNYRGPNKTPESGGSEFVIGDVQDAVEHALAAANIDEDRIYLIGGSGGGYNALQVASKLPMYWAAVSAWVPITNLKDWYYQNRAAQRRYADDIVAVTGGEPGQSSEIDREYFDRSPINWLQSARHIPIDIAAGIFDGHNGSVPIDHSLNAFNKLAFPEDTISSSQIAFFVDSASVPPLLQMDVEDDTYPENKTPLFRRVSRKARITLFDGGHDTLYNTGLIWLSKQKRGKMFVH